MAHDQELIKAVELGISRWSVGLSHEQLRACVYGALNALDAAGFVVMPKEPTAEMVAYAREAHIERVRRKVRDGTIGLDPDGTLVEQYRAMLRGRHPPSGEEAGDA